MASTKRRNWCEAPLDIIYEVVNRKELSLADVWRMGAVCKSWRSILLENDWFGLQANVNIGKSAFPWLMLAEKDDGSDMRGFYNPAIHKVSERYLPEAKGRRCCGSGYGWIVTMGEDMEIKLLNPITREQLNLPSQLTFTEFYGPDDLYVISNTELHAEFSKKEILSSFIVKAILTCNPNEGDRCVVVAHLFANWDFQLVFAKPNDPAWTVFPHSHRLHKPLTSVRDILFCQGKLFCVTGGGDLIILNLHEGPECRWEMIFCETLERHWENRPRKKKFYCSFSLYLVLIGGELVSVFRMREVEKRKINVYRTWEITLFEWRENREWCQINRIGDCSLFLGTNESICISPAPRGFCANSIYFTDDLIFVPGHHTHTGKDMVAYCMDNNEFIPFYNGEDLLSEFSPSLWVKLNSN